MGKRKIQNFDWSPENIQKLKDLWEIKPSLSAENIANHFKGLSRNAVIGKAHRLGLDHRKKASPPKAQSIVRLRKTPFVKPLLAAIPAPQLVPQALEAPKGNLIPFMKINYRTCRSIEGYEMVGPHRMAMYCSNPKEAEESFCPYHQSIYYRQDVRR